jgi:hypothetical protein
MKKPMKTRALRSTPRYQIEPTNERNLKFCDRWLVHHDHIRAYTESGFSMKRSNWKEIALEKLRRFHDYLDRRLPAVEAVVAQRIAYEREDILREIAKIATCNALDYIEEYSIVDDKTKEAKQAWRLKPIAKLTRDQASAIDTVFVNIETGVLGYSLPSAKTRLSALATLGEQAADFKKKDGAVHNHLHFHDIPLDKIRQLKQQLIGIVGPARARAVFGRTEEEATGS